MSMKDNIEKEVITDDNKTSRLEAIINLGKNLSGGLFIVWGSLVIYGSIVAEPLGYTGDQALQTATVLFPVVASVVSTTIGVLIGKEISK